MRRTVRDDAAKDKTSHIPRHVAAPALSSERL